MDKEHDDGGIFLDPRVPAATVQDFSGIRIKLGWMPIPFFLGVVFYRSRARVSSSTVVVAAGGTG